MTGYIAEEWAPLLRGIEYRAGSLEAMTVNGLEAATIAGTRACPRRLAGYSPGGDPIRATRVYRFWLIAPSRDMGALERDLHATVHSFRRLSHRIAQKNRQEAARVRPLLLLVVPAAPGDKVGSLAYQLERKVRGPTTRPCSGS